MENGYMNIYCLQVQQMITERLYAAVDGLNNDRTPFLVFFLLSALRCDSVVAFFLLSALQCDYNFCLSGTQRRNDDHLRSVRWKRSRNDSP